MRWMIGALAAGFVMAGPALAQTADPIPAEVQTVAATTDPTPAEVQPAVAIDPAAPASIRIPAGTVVEVELTEALSSETSQQEQLFGLRLAAPIVIDGREVVAAGAPGGGEVIDAARSAFGGRAGRLIVSGRYIEIGGQRARIRGMQITAAGDHRVNTALVVSMIPYAGVAAIFISGGKVEIPVGSRGTARLAADVDLPLDAAPADAPALTEASAEIPSTPASTPELSTSGENQQ